MASYHPGRLDGREENCESTEAPFGDPHETQSNNPDTTRTLPRPARGIQRSVNPRRRISQMTLRQQWGILSAGRECPCHRGSCSADASCEARRIHPGPNHHPPPTLDGEGFQPHDHPGKRAHGTTAGATECAGRHIEGPQVRSRGHKSPGRHYLPRLNEPPVGIEPTTYSLRVNRSAD